MGHRTGELFQALTYLGTQGYRYPDPGSLVTWSNLSQKQVPRVSPSFLALPKQSNPLLYYCQVN